jgi:hypothetical protein
MTLGEQHLTMRRTRKQQQVLPTNARTGRKLRAVFGLAILTIVASSAQGQTVTWGGSVRLDDGFAPRIAASGTTVVQVHQAKNEEGPLWYRTARLGPSGSIRWFGSGSLEYDNGFAPSVAVAGTAVVEVHQGDPGTIWYRTGQIRLDGTIQWSGSLRMDDGFAPSVTASGTTVVQVHQAADAEGPLWYRTGQLGRNGTIHWNGSGSLQYDNGFAPSVAASGPVAVEIHQGDPGTIWSRVGQD